MCGRIELVAVSGALNNQPSRGDIGMSMSSDPAGSPRPGRKQGPTSELTTFFKVRPGHEEQLRELLENSGRRSDEERQVIGLKIGTLHEMRWALFDDDTRMLFCTSYDGEWDPYIDDFARVAQGTFDRIFPHVEGYPEGGIRDPRAKDFVIEHQVTTLDYTRFSDATIKDVRKALAIRKAFQDVLDTPEFRQALDDSTMKPVFDTPAFRKLLDLAAD